MVMFTMLDSGVPDISKERATSTLFLLKMPRSHTDHRMSTYAQRYCFSDTSSHAVYVTARIDRAAGARQHGASDERVFYFQKYVHYMPVPRCRHTSPHAQIQRQRLDFCAAARRVVAGSMRARGLCHSLLSTATACHDVRRAILHFMLPPNAIAAPFCVASRDATNGMSRQRPQPPNGEGQKRAAGYSAERCVRSAGKVRGGMAVLAQ